KLDGVRFRNPELKERVELEACVGPRLDSLQGLDGRFVVRYRGTVSAVRHGPLAGRVEISGSTVPYFPAASMMGECFDPRAEFIRRSRFECGQDTLMDLASALEQQGSVGDLERERVLERVLEVGEEPRFVEELRRLEPAESLTGTLLRLLGDRLQQCEWHILADDGRCLE